MADTGAFGPEAAATLRRQDMAERLFPYALRPGEEMAHGKFMRGTERPRRRKRTAARDMPARTRAAHGATPTGTP